MADTAPPIPGTPTVLLPEAEVRRVVDALAARIAPVIDDETVAAVLLTGGLWFAADLTRALSRLGRNVRFDALWLASYGDEQSSRGRIDVYADFQRSIEGRRVLIIDDVFVGWDAPNRFLVGYGLDHAGALRGLPDVCALD